MTHVREAANQGLRWSVHRLPNEEGVGRTWPGSARESPFPLTAPDRERVNGAQQRLVGFSDCRKVARSDS